MERNELLRLIKNGLNPQVSAEFSAEDANSAALNALFEAIGINADASIRELKRNPGAFAIIEEAIDEMLPQDLQNILGQFAEIKSFARDAEVIFKMSNVGKRRAKLSITKGARGGIYRAARLDAKQLQLPTDVYTAAVFVTLEDILLGTYTLAELYANILEGFEQIIYKDTIEALQNAETVAPSANIITVAGTVTLPTALDDAIAIVKAYGNPIIVGFRSAISKINNIDTIGGGTINPGRAYADLDDIRNKGFVQLYKGVPVQEITNFFVDEQNASKLIGNENYIFVLPADTKPVKVALKGEMTLIDNRQATGSEKWEAHKIMGVGLLLANDVCVIKS